MVNRLNARMINLHDTEENWNKLTGFVPKSGEVIFFEPDSNYSYVRLKFGDGNTLLRDLPFINDTMLDEVIKWEDEIGYLDSDDITTYKTRTLYKFKVLDTNCECIPGVNWGQWINSLWPKIAGFTAYSVSENNTIIIEGNVIKDVTASTLIIENETYTKLSN